MQYSRCGRTRVLYKFNITSGVSFRAHVKTASRIILYRRPVLAHFLPPFFCPSPSIFTARRCASALLAMGLCLFVSVSVCLSVCLSVSVTSRSSSKTAKRRITQTTPHDSTGSLVFERQRSLRNFTGITPCGAPNAGGVGQNRRLSTNNRLYLENGKR